ncbi:hypothetical protein IAI18_22635 [Acetobacteraceae bacterium H6797]|nr:hypothetical protein [Acetobacteraceae bacterium H6797]
MSGLTAAEAEASAGASRLGRPAHGRAAQSVFIAFGGRADQAWLRLLSPGFRHCFAALHDPAQGWLVVDPLSGRMVAQVLEVPPDFDLPAFYRRAGLAVLGPFTPGPAQASRLPNLLPLSCVSVCRAILGAGAPFALTPYGLFKALTKTLANRPVKKDDLPRKIYVDRPRR